MAKKADRMVSPWWQRVRLTILAAFVGWVVLMALVVGATLARGETAGGLGIAAQWMALGVATGWLYILVPLVLVIPEDARVFLPLPFGLVGIVGAMFTAVALAAFLPIPFYLLFLAPIRSGDWVPVVPVAATGMTAGATYAVLLRRMRAGRRRP